MRRTQCEDVRELYSRMKARLSDQIANRASIACIGTAACHAHDLSTSQMTPYSHDFSIPSGH